MTPACETDALAARLSQLERSALGLGPCDEAERRAIRASGRALAPLVAAFLQWDAARVPIETPVDYRRSPAP